MVSSVNKWKFDSKIALIYEDHVQKHIPLYQETIDWCLEWAVENLSLDAPILDFGCATGCTLRRFKKAGFTNLWGVDQSESMWKSYQCNTINYSTECKIQPYALTLANWTLHFNENKWSILHHLREMSEVLIVSEKCIQTPSQQADYWRWKQQQGVTADEIVQKAISLEGVMFLDFPDAYPGECIHSMHEFYTWIINGS